MKGEISCCVWLPRSAINVRETMRRLTVTYRPMGADEPVIVTAYRIDRTGYLGVPRQFGLELARSIGIELEDKTSAGTKASYPRRPELRDYQEPYVGALLDLADCGRDVVAQAGTGKGKTTMALYTLSELGCNAIVIVDQENLRDQWIDRAKAQYGLRDSDIGIVQGDVFEYVGKTLVVAMVQTLTRKKFPQHFYDYFGAVIFDESHMTGAPVFSAVLMAFSAAFRCGISATPERRDSLQKLIDWNLGPVALEMRSEHRKSRVYYVESEATFSWYANTSPKTGRYLQEVSEHVDRNQLLCRIIVALRGMGHQILAVSDRIEQVEALMCMCALSGVPESEMGLYAGYRTVWGFSKDPKPSSRPKGWERGTKYTPVRYTAVRKRIPKAELSRVKESASILFATYGMFAKGVDVPRLSAGVDCTPRSTATQVHGRILREDDKLTPVWVTVRDVNSHRADYQFGNRVSEYVASNAEIYQWVIEKGIRLADVSALKRDVRDNVAYLKTCRYTETTTGKIAVVGPEDRPKK